MVIHGALKAITYRILVILSNNSRRYAADLGLRKIQTERTGLRLWFSVYGNSPSNSLRNRVKRQINPFQSASLSRSGSILFLNDRLLTLIVSVAPVKSASFLAKPAKPVRASGGKF
jgi:hypothetical protein